MIDMHCHILPGVDDGSKSLEESVEMAKIAYADGIRHIINTSHYHTEADYVTGKRLLEIASEFNAVLGNLGIGVRVQVGNELYFNEGLMKALDEGGFYTLAGSRYVLVEFRPDKVPEDIAEVAYEFSIRGYVPIVAHVERYAQVLGDMGMAKRMIEAGFLLQVNSRSLLGKRGTPVFDFCEHAVKNRMIHFVASDAHDSRVRTPKMSGAYEKAKELAGEDIANEIFISNPQRILKDEEIVPFEIVEHQKKGLIARLFKRK
ncbi:protein-tyrosine phosphatase [Peptoclostridium litorale DSM 5388]|uniref:protein-tyrosine-phosphatase n=1 Tax=Peptoclostridium litorale DSM 5388 TaxID=1121324 RepID=A0A069RCD1_PEPLI|nr:CpsB/CapC family capsule biosynthesis tyrosine phosphatase [Peptoclostridium litorale]KDR94666.1 PHP domain-containing protein [Peptoclostridium litorale DSM 5388]SIO30041.1 protein-tyrosine phosphatase [Peptoclostridium litorale DSM 5388]